MEHAVDLAELRRRVRGRVVALGDTEYESLRRELVWNRLVPERRPAAVVRVASADDVVEVVRFARQTGVRVSVRSGGHSWVAAPQREGALLLDLAALRGIEIDPEARRARVQPGAIGRELSRLLAEHGLAFPTGHCSSVALGGYLLAGGFGWNTGAWGPACMSVRAVDVVTAAGELIRADETRNAEFLWAARGGGPEFFGVVTRFEIELQSLPRAIAGTAQVYPLACLREVAHWLPQVSAAVPPEVEVTLLAGVSPAAPADGPVAVVTAAAFCDQPAAVERALRPLAESPLLRRASRIEAVRPTSLEALYDGMDARFPPGHRYLADTFWSNDPPAEVLGGLGPLLARAPSPRSMVLCVAPPPPPADAPSPPAAAFSMVGGLLTVPYAIWDDAAGDGVNRAWHDEVVAALDSSAIGHYLGEADIVAHPQRLERSFAAANWRQLQALRRQYDPHGLFL